jgi:hypothetical protein
MRAGSNVLLKLAAPRFAHDHLAGLDRGGG